MPEQNENIFEAAAYPELVFGIAGAIGINIDEIIRTLSVALSTVGYHSVPIRITEEIAQESSDVSLPPNANFAEEMSFKMTHASAVCRKYDSPDTLMRFAIAAIQRHRGVMASDIASTESGKTSAADTPPEEKISPKTAYIIRQLKRPEEVQLLRKVYGKQFILISAYGSSEERQKILQSKLKRSMPLDISAAEIITQAIALIHRDEDENTDAHGQHLRDTFSLADVFIDGISKTAMTSMTVRFIEAFFGRADIAPSKHEYGMYAAKSASLRSTDLSRQVGAAIFSADGELITQGCNEVPKALGGTYWDGEEPDYRDVKLGYDPNETLKKEVIRDLLERLLRGGMLSEAATKIGTSSELVDALIKKRPIDKTNELGYGSLHEASIMELTEYGRVVHAEMCAICDAARLGRSIKGSILFCTTFPCHNCTKHLLAAGIRRVIYMEPYPKSKAKELHEHEIEIEKPSETRVSFLPFLGISPYRYRDIFQKGKRKENGQAKVWIQGEPKPQLEPSPPSYIDLEAFELSKLIGGFRDIEKPAE